MWKYFQVNASLHLKTFHIQSRSINMAEPWATMKSEEQFAQDPLRFLSEEFRDSEKDRLD
jgi:hypothetical protein